MYKLYEMSQNMALNSYLYFHPATGSKRVLQSVRLVTVADNLQQHSIEILILPKVTTRYVA